MRSRSRIDGSVKFLNLLQFSFTTLVHLRLAHGAAFTPALTPQTHQTLWGRDPSQPALH